MPDHSSPLLSMMTVLKLLKKSKHPVECVVLWSHIRVKMAASEKETDCFDSNSKCKDTSDEWNSREKDGYHIWEMPFYILVQVYCYCRKVRLSLKWLKSSATTVRYRVLKVPTPAGIHACDNNFLLHYQGRQDKKRLK